MQRKSVKMGNNNIKVKILNRSGNKMPEYATAQSAGMGLRAWLSHPIVLQPSERVLVPTGIYLQLPDGYECQLRPRSSLALKHGITILDSPVTIGADFRGEIGVLLVNISKEPFVINNGDLICQMVIAPYCRAEWEQADESDNVWQTDGSFGHTCI